MDLLTQFALIILVGIVSGYFAIKAKLPLLVGYIIGGIIIGIVLPSELLSFESLSELGEIGIALLLFTIGIELNLEDLFRVKKYALWGGIAQIILTTLFGIVIFPIFGFTSYESLFLGALFSLSSTAVVIKILEDIGQVETNAGQIIIGWLILQDIAVVMIIELLGAFVTSPINFTLVIDSLIKGGLVIMIAVVSGKYLLPFVSEKIAKLGSKELLIVIAIGFALGFALLSQFVGVSFTFGAFLAGVMISDTVLKHEVFSEIKPLQVLFALFFFIVIGTLFSFDYFVSNLLLIIAILFTMILVKFLIVFFITIFLKLHIRNAIEVAIGLSQVGEFAFLGSQIGLVNGWISLEINSLIISVTVFSLIISSILIVNTDYIYESIRSYAKIKFPKLYRKYFLAIDNDLIIHKKRNNHIIICGYGRVGKYIALSLRRLHYKQVLIEMDANLINETKELGFDTIFGDATSEEMLLIAGIKEAKAIIIALPKEADVENILSKISQINPTVEIVFRTNDLRSKIKESNFVNIVEPEFEAAYRIVEQTLKILGKKDKKILKWLREQELNLVV